MEETRRRIVEKHAQALLDELKAHGFDPLGIAGGIVLGEPLGSGGSPCHVFYILEADVVTAGGQCTPEKFVRDVAQTMKQYDGGGAASN